MIITPLKTPRIEANAMPLVDLVLQALSEAPDLQNDSPHNDGLYSGRLHDGDVLAVSSKIVALCENNVRPMGSTDREALITEQSDYYLPKERSQYGHHFTITNHTLVGSAGIDASNGGQHFVLWPEDPQASANTLRAQLSQHFGLGRIGIIITDSTSQPLRLGTIGIAVAHSGFLSINDYRGQPDLFGRQMQTVRLNVAGSLAAAANLAMGEGSEQTPLCIIRDIPSITFRDRDPSPDELAEIHLSMEDDLFAPFWQSVPWQAGGRRGNGA